jgi:hypothetical protein
MLKNRIIWLATLLPVVLAIQPACAQGVPTSGMYQIVSGRYISCCGFGGAYSTPLPNANDAFIELTVDLQNNLAQMRILGQDMHTVFQTPTNPSGEDFTYSFSNGIVFPDHIEFGKPFVPPVPDQASFGFVVSNSMDTILLNGTVIVPCVGCGDIPEAFQHTNVVAVLMPAATIRVSEVEVCWKTVSNRTYQVQYRSTLSTTAWTNLGPAVAGNGSTNCITDKVPLGRPQGFYRVLTLP